jgi:hypothetical protein
MTVWPLMVTVSVPGYDGVRIGTLHVPEPISYDRRSYETPRSSRHFSTSARSIRVQPAIRRDAINDDGVIPNIHASLGMTRSG